MFHCVAISGGCAIPPGKIRAARDQARTPLIREVRPRPLDQNQHAILETNQKKNVNKQPCQPRHEPGDMNLAELRHRSGTANRCQTAFIPVMKRRARRRLARLALGELNLMANQLGYIASLQNGHGRHARKHLS